MFERFSRSARVSVVLAQEEARELSSDEIRPEHLLVGVLQSAGRDLSGVLGGYGLTADTIRGRLESADSAGRGVVRSGRRGAAVDRHRPARRPRRRGPNASARTPMTTHCESRAGAGAAAGIFRSPSRPRRCSSCPCEKPWRTRTTGSAASTSCSASCAAATSSRWA